MPEPLWIALQTHVKSDTSSLYYAKITRERHPMLLNILIFYFTDILEDTIIASISTWSGVKIKMAPNVCAASDHVTEIGENVLIGYSFSVISFNRLWFLRSTLLSLPAGQVLISCQHLSNMTNTEKINSYIWVQPILFPLSGPADKLAEKSTACMQ